MAEILGRHDESKDQGARLTTDEVSPHEKVRELDAFLSERRRYLEVHECVREALRETHIEAQSSPR